MPKRITPVRRNSFSNPVASTTVRNTAIPKVQPVASKTITHEMIARRAYEISQSPQCSSEFDNWVRAEKELRGQA